MIEVRSIDELIARYQLEPQLRDVYVEGPFDQELLTQAFSTNGQNDRIVYDINSVNVPGDIVAGCGLTNGNKQRVIALAEQLAVIQGDAALRLLVDKDLDHWFGPLRSAPRLLYTDHCSIELCFFVEGYLLELANAWAKAKIDDWAKFMDSLVAVLRDLYILRLVDRELDLSLKWLPIKKLLDRKSSQIAFQIDLYIDRLLVASGKGNMKKDFQESVKSWRGRLSGDPRQYIRGHDFVEVITWAFREFGGIKEIASETALMRMFIFSAKRFPETLRPFLTQG
jgi:hypothetical protein